MKGDYVYIHCYLTMYSCNHPGKMKKKEYDKFWDSGLLRVGVVWRGKGTNMCGVHAINIGEDFSNLGGSVYFNTFFGGSGGPLGGRMIITIRL